MAQTLVVLSCHCAAHLGLNIQLKNVIEAVSIHAEATNGENVLADDKSSGVDAARHACHVRHQHFLVEACV